MPVDPSMSGPMLDPFRNMVAEIDGKGLSGSAVDEMREQMATMERLAQECGDIAALSGQLAQLGTFQKFSDAYGRALSEAAQPKGGAGAQPTDEEMLANSLSAYEGTLSTYKSGQAGQEGTLLIPYIERILEIGRSGVSFPVFLRMLEEEGLNKVMDGAAPAVRPRLVEAIETARKYWAPPFAVGAARNALAVFDDMASKAPFGQPDSLQFSLIQRAMEWELAPVKARWDEIIRLWETLLMNLVDWLDAHTKFAPSDERWAPKGASPEAVKKNIARTKECGSCDFRYMERIMGWYFGLSFDQIWTHETFVHQYTSNMVDWSDVRLEICRDVYQYCVPGGVAPPELIARAEASYPGSGDYRPDRRQHPPADKPLCSVPWVTI